MTSHIYDDRRYRIDTIYPIWHIRGLYKYPSAGQFILFINERYATPRMTSHWIDTCVKFTKEGGHNFTSKKLSESKARARVHHRGESRHIGQMEDITRAKHRVHLR